MQNKTNESPTQVINKVLEIIDYQENKDQFTHNLLKLCDKQAFMNLVKMLSNDQQVLLSKDLSTEDNSAQVMENYFNDRQKYDALKDATAQIIEEYIRTIMPTLNKDQLIKLEEHFKNMQPLSN